ncbi:E3 ubiquitin-protein ligase RNF167-like [Sceloporus undulatus]|uniref:E3 ubiquitin-protein ligase RNF167-like n=1 Tax=Sceloporus undulatus TaxID=8520 RepID=UPI001C4ADC53|nr:E3 ubiquitin-protein ligase RNF167-like [Sceloporus undulatus]
MPVATPSPLHVVLVIILFYISANDALIRAVYNHNGISQDFKAQPSDFGPQLYREVLLGYIVEAKPANACHPIRAPPPCNGSSIAFVALIQRYNCSFITKVLHAQKAGYHAAIIHNVNSQALVIMLSENEDAKGQVGIPSVFIGESASTQLKWIFYYDPTAYIILIPDCPWPSCWGSRHICQTSRPKTGKVCPKQTSSCLPNQCHFFSSSDFYFLCLAFMAWIATMYVLCHMY